MMTQRCRMLRNCHQQNDVKELPDDIKKTCRAIAGPQRQECKLSEEAMEKEDID
jgi:hypothetical protein